VASGSRRGTQEKSIVAANLASLLALKAHLNEHIAEDGLTVFAHACQLGAEGIVSKKVDGAYQSGRCRVWIKVRNPASIAVQREHGEIWNQGGSARRR
jgi:ATP-dependent DNA ligase